MEAAKTTNEKAKTAQALVEAQQAVLVAKQKLEADSKLVEQYKYELSELDELEELVPPNAAENDNEQEGEVAQEAQNFNSIANGEENNVVRIHALPEGDASLRHVDTDNINVLGNTAQNVHYDLD